MDTAHSAETTGEKLRDAAEYQQQLAAEQNQVDHCYQRLDELHAEKKNQLKQLHRAGAQGSMQNQSERDSFATLYEDRIAQLEAVDERLVFGRLDFSHTEQPRYIGRIGLSTAEQRRLLLDWRAPEAAAFYQATAADPQGVQRRRHILLAGRRVAAIEDDVLDAELLDEPDAIQGHGALLAALSSHRTGQMNDIVATIQSEQDAIIRAPLNQALVVQGGPGTGKTAVALHRAAYLLYTHRQRLADAGVLLVGPSTSFLHYIERVLPALGETGVTLASLDTMLPGVEVTGEEQNPQISRLKGQLYWRDIIANAVALRQRHIPAEREVKVRSRTLVIKPSLIDKALAHAQQARLPYNQAREVFVKTALKKILDLYLTAERRAAPGISFDETMMEADLRESRDVRVLLNLCWMPLRAQDLLSQLLTKESFLAAAAPMLSAAERALLIEGYEGKITAEDLPLLDLAMDLLGPLHGSAAATVDSQRSRDEENAEAALANVQHQLADIGVDGIVDVETLVAMNSTGQQRLSPEQSQEQRRQWAYGHIIVDEAQELSPMQWHFLAQRCPMKSMTIVGDIAQASAPAAASSWAEAMAPIVEDRFQLEELSVNYRTPAEVMALAQSWAEACELPYTHTTSVRSTGHQPLRAGDLAHGLRDEVMGYIAEHLPAQGMMAVICPAAWKATLHQWLNPEFGHKLGTGSGTIERNLVLLTATEAKGLEFDVVLVVAAEEIAQGGAAGDLFVAMTRATQRLALLSEKPLPESLR